MIESIEVKNYKALDRIRVEGFSNINVFVGANNCGKTSLLEAVFLNFQPANRNLVTTSDMRQIRLKHTGIDIFFNKLNLDKPIEIKTIYNGKDITTKIKPKISNTNIVNIDQDNTLEVNNSNNIKNMQSVIGLDFDIHFNGESHKQEFNLNKMEISNAQYQPFSTFFIPTDSIFINLPAIIATLRVLKKKEILIKHLKEFDKNIIDVDSIQNLGVMIDLNYMPQQISVNAMGEGFKKYLCIIAALVTEQTNYICIDEIENGLHFESTKKLIESIIELCKQTNIQLFISTHSYEFLEILNQVALDKEYENVAVFNIRQTKLKGLQAYKYDLSGLDNFLATNTEIRR